MKEDLDEISLPGFLLFPSTRCQRDPLEFLFGKGRTLRDFCLPGSLRGCGRLCGDAEERNKPVRAVGIAVGLAGGPAGTDPLREVSARDSVVLSRLQNGSSLPINFGEEDRS